MKLKKIFLSFLMIFSLFCISACNKKEETTEPPVAVKQDPVIMVSYNKGISYYAGDALETVELVLVGEGTAGTIAWESPSTTLELGTKSYKWVFVPTDASKFNSKTGSIEVTARTPLIAPVVSDVKIKAGQDIYIDSLLSKVELDSNFASNVDGTVVWSNPNKTLKAGDNTCAWVFIPTDTETYSRVTGTIVVTATQNQYLSSISVKSNTKDTGYVAYDKFDCSGLTLNLNYNSGKVTPVRVNSSECSITYKNGSDSFRQGETSVIIQYLGQTCEVVIQPVGYRIVEKPEFTDTIVYDGYSHTLTVAESSEGFYTIGDAFGVDAGDNYELKLTLTDTQNLKWPDSETAETIVLCSIQKAEHEIVKNELEVDYDGEAHSSSAGGIQVTQVYYSLNEINEQNFAAASTTPIEFVNAGIYTINYYAVGNNNYKDMVGTIKLTINKQTPVMLLEYAYSLSTGNEICYPAQYVTIQDKNGTEIPRGELRFTYYNAYLDEPTPEKPNEKTNGLNSGSKTIGGAPVNHKDGVYYVVVEYLGDNQNYAPNQGVAELFIDVVDNGLYSLDTNKEFSFKIMEDGDVVTYPGVEGLSITGTNSKECDAYIKFNKQINASTGLTELLFDSKFGTGASSIKTGRLVYVTSEYQLEFDDGSAPMIMESGEETVTVYLSGGQTKVLSKWEIPNFNLVSYTAQTVEEAGEKNNGQNTTITFYNDYGTIRFSADVNVESKTPLVPPNAPEVGGHETWGGVVVVGMVKDADGVLYYTLSCYIISSTSLTSEGFSKEGKSIVFRWAVPLEGNPDMPNSITLYAGDKIEDLIYASLETTYYKV